MPISTSEFLSEVSQLLAGLAPDAMQSREYWDLFEALVFALVVKSARDSEAEVDLLDSAGAQADQYLFRSSPGSLANPSRNFTHAEIRFDGLPPLEVHNGIWVSGKSLVPHECDCVVLRKDEADAVRANVRLPLWGAVLLHAECKHYEKRLPLAQGRGFLGLALDLGWKNGVLLMNRSKPRIVQLVQSRRKASAQRLQPGNLVDRQQALSLFKRRLRRYRDTGDV